MNDTSSGLAVQVDDLRMRFGDEAALDGLSFEVPAGTICGVLGRNGAGKTTMLRLLAAYERPTSGSVLVDGQDPYEDERLMSEICLVRDTGNVADESKVKDEIELCELLRPRWDGEYAARLLDRFHLDTNKKVGKLSRGQKSSLAIVIGLATRAPLTMFDEPHLGLDAPARATFYDELLADYIEHPRTILLSSHLIDEVAPLLERVLVIDHGTLLVDDDAEALRAKGAEVSGPADLVEAFTLPLEVLATRRLGATAASTVFTELSPEQRAQAASVGLDIGPLPLQDLFIALTAKEHTR